MNYTFRISKGFISPQSLTYFWNETRKADIIMINLPSFEGIALALIAKIRSKPVITLLHCEVLLPFSPLNWIINTVLNCGVFLQLLLSNKIIIYTEDYYKDKPMYQIFKRKMEPFLPPINSAHPDELYLKELKKRRKEFKYVVGFCGRIAAEKGIEVLIESISKLDNTLLCFAGPIGKDVAGEDKYFEKIDKMLMEKKIPHIFLGTLLGGKLSSFYKSIDVLALPSLNRTEAFGMVQVEAMLQGTPVVASDLPGVRIPIQMTRMGILVPPSSQSDLTDAFHHILRDKVHFSNTYLIERARTLFDSKKTYDSIYTIMRRIISR